MHTRSAREGHSLCCHALPEQQHPSSVASTTASILRGQHNSVHPLWPAPDCYVVCPLSVCLAAWISLFDCKVAICFLSGCMAPHLWQCGTHCITALLHTARPAWQRGCVASIKGCTAELPHRGCSRAAHHH